MLMRSLSPRETWLLQQRWRSAFARRLYRITGRWARGGSDRHLFHPEYVRRYLTGVAAEQEYAMVSSGAVYLVDDEGLGEQHDQKPKLEMYIEERGVLIFPETYEWTIAVGPDYFDRVCFTYCDWVDDKNGFDGEECE